MKVTIYFKDTAPRLPVGTTLTVSPNGWVDLSCDTLDVLDLDKDGDEYMVAQFNRDCVYGWTMEREGNE